MVRRATLDDLDAIAELMKDAHAKSENYKDLPYNEFRTRIVLEAFMTKPKVLFLVTDSVDGMLIGEVTPSWFHNGLTAITHMAYAREGANGLPLLREFLKWARSWDAVRKIQVSTSFSGERGERAERLIERLGLSPVGKQFVEIR